MTPTDFDKGYSNTVFCVISTHPLINAPPYFMIIIYKEFKEKSEVLKEKKIRELTFFLIRKAHGVLIAKNTVIIHNA